MGAAPRARAHARRHSGLHTRVHTHSRMQKHTQASVYASTRSEPTDRHASRWTPRRTSTQARTLHITHRQAGTQARRWARRWAHTPSPGVGGWSLLALRPRPPGALRGGGVAISSRIHTQCCAVPGCYARRPSPLAPRPSPFAPRSGSRGHASARPAPTRETHPPQRVSLNFLQSVVLAFLPHSGAFPRG